MSDVTKICGDLNELHPHVKKQADMLLEECKKQGLNAKVLETYRTQARQDYLYAQGRTRPGSIVTNAKTSVHTSRRAFDVIQNIKGKEYDDVFLAKVGQIGKKLGLDWGGDWKGFTDSPHFENQNLTAIPKEVDIVIKVTIELNGKLTEVDAIEKDGNNYIKLRDLAKDGKIIVEYDSVRKIPVVKTK